MDGWMNRWMDKWMDKWMDGWTEEWLGWYIMSHDVQGTSLPVDL